MTQKAIEELLEKLYFTAVNSIDIFDDKHFIVGKKMHVWGKGL